MKNNKKERMLTDIEDIIKSLIAPLQCRLDEINLKISAFNSNPRPKYYRNGDLKKNFGLSNNTIIKYRQEGVLPFTRMGDIFLYEAAKIEEILQSRADGKE